MSCKLNLISVVFSKLTYKHYALSYYEDMYNRHI